MGSYQNVYVPTLETELMALLCIKCGVVFGIGKDYMKGRREDHEWFYCPNGHTQHYTQETEAESQRKRAEKAEREAKAARAGLNAARDQADAAERSRAAIKGHNTRMRRRIANGVCPCCHRSFADLAAHMAGQHPDFAVEEVPGEH